MLDGVLRREVFKIAYDAGSYRDYSLATLDDCIFQACIHDKGLMWFSVENGLSGIMTWAMLSPDNVQGFLNGDVLRGDDFENDEGELWVIDFLAPYGDVPQMMRQAQVYFANRYGSGTVVQWKRPWRHRPKLGYAIAKETGNELVQ